MAEQKFLIVMRSGPIPGSSYFIEKDEVFLGRDLTNDLPVPDPEISRRHARFLRRGDAIYIEDLGSTNGTFLNGVRISSPQRLNNGDLITLAEATVMSFEWQGSVQAAAYTPTYGTPAPQPEPVKSKSEPVYQSVQAPTPQRSLAPEPTPTKKTRKPWYLNFLVVLLIILIIIALVLTFMPASWWCFLSFNRLPGCY